MGEHNVSDEKSGDDLRGFQRALLDDLRALERMLRDDVFDAGPPVIGAEQEMFLVDESLDPAFIGPEVLELANEPRLTTEIARFNLEANLTPRKLETRALSALERELTELIETTRKSARALGAEVVLTGTLPTLRHEHINLDAMTPSPRYFALNDMLRRMRGDGFSVHIKGIDELDLSHPDIMLESCNTSFQLHYQVPARAFAAHYNIAQLITAPILASSVNSPLLLGQRLWKETRIALFQQSVDTRRHAHHAREAPPRVVFGDSWMGESVLEIFRQNIERYRVVLTSPDPLTSSCAALDRGEVPELRALRLHNGTVYRWNRPCYGVIAGVPHLRIEARAFPSGPSVIDQMATAALFFGLLAAGREAFGDITTQLPFSAVKEAFFAAARHGLAAQITWLDGKTHPAHDLLLRTLLPVARDGLASLGIDRDDVARYLGIVERRVEAGITGADWALRSLTQMEGKGNRDQRMRRLVRDTLAHQTSNTPVHTWPLASLEQGAPTPESFRTVGQFMTTDLLTVREGDAIDLATSLMRWRNVRHVPVEDDDGKVVGILTPEAVLRHLGEHGFSNASVGEVMEPCAPSLARTATPAEALRLMRDHGASALPVVDGGRLVGLLTERDLLRAGEVLLAHFPWPDGPRSSRGPSR